MYIFHVFNIGCNHEDESHQLTGLPAKLLFFMNIFESFPADSSPVAKTVLCTLFKRSVNYCLSYKEIKEGNKR